MSIFKHISANRLPLVISLFVFSVFAFFSWLASEPVRASKIDNSILYYVDDVFRFCYLKASFFRPEAFLNPNAKILSLVISRIFFQLLPLGMVSMRIMNSLFSAGIIFLLYKLTDRLFDNKRFLFLPVLLTVTSSAYFLGSFSTLSEIMFTFFLMLAVYFFHAGRHLASTVTISFLPTIRQEGAVFIILWLCLLLRNRQFRHAIWLFIPSFSWSLLNSLILRHDLLYTFFYMHRLSRQTPPISLILPSQINTYIIWSSLVLCLLLLSGIKMCSSDKRYSLIFSCILFHLGFMVLSNSVKWVTTGFIVREIKYVIPSIPFMAIFMSRPIESLAQRLSSRYRMAGPIALILLLAALPGFMCLKLKALQKIPQVVNDSVSPEESETVRNVSVWLNGYMAHSGINNLYVYGSQTTNKFVRRLWMGSPGSMGFYAIVSKDSAMDMITFQKAPFIKGRAVVVYSGNDTFQLPDGIEKEHLKGFPEISLDFFLVKFN